MFSSVETRYCAFFLISCIVLIHVVSVTAKIRMRRPPPRPRPPPIRRKPPPRVTKPRHRPADHTRRPDHNYNPSHHQPSAPKEPPHRPASANDHNQATPHGSTPGGGYPPWANPAVGPHAGPSHNAPGFSQPHGSPFQNGPHNPSHPGSSNGPYGNSHSYSPIPPHMGGQSAPLPGMIPNHHNLPPMGSHQNPAGYPNHGNQPYYAGSPMNQPHVPGHTTAFLPNQQSSGPGLGQLVKEAAVMSAVNWGVRKTLNAGFDMLKGDKPHHQPPANSFTPSPIQTSTRPAVTNPANHQNQTEPQRPSDNPLNLPDLKLTEHPEVPSSMNASSTHNLAGHETTHSGALGDNFNVELWRISAELFEEDGCSMSKLVELNEQNYQTGNSTEDVAFSPLFYVESEVDDIPTIEALRNIYDHYEFDSTKKEVMTADAREEESIMLEKFLKTEPMEMAMSWLAEKGYIESDSLEWKRTLRRIWMTRVGGTTSGFERIFMAEKYGQDNDSTIIGAQNWVYIEDKESVNHIDYMGYVDGSFTKLGQGCSLITIYSEIDKVVKPSTILVGTPPELEMALYTVCFYARPNAVCNVYTGVTQFNIYTQANRFYGKDVIEYGYMFI